MPADTLRIGVLFSQTGVTSVIERTQLAATQLAIDEVNERGGIGGRFLEAVVYDPRSDPALFRKYARRLIEEDGISTIFGCYMSSTRRAILPTIERNNALLCYPTFYEGFEFSENVLYFGSLPNQTNNMLIDYVMRHYGGRVFLLGSDYLFPRESNRLMHSIMASRGGTVVGEFYVPLAAPPGHFDRAVAEATAASPDFIFSTLVGNDVAKFYRAFYEQGLDAMTMPIASATATEAELAALPPGIAAGHITAAPYFATIETAENRRFVRNLQRKFGSGIKANMCAEAAYIAVHFVAQGLQLAESGDPRSLVRALHGIRFDAPQGAVKIDAENNHSYLFSRVGRMRLDGLFDIVEESAESIKPDPYFVEFGATNSNGRRTASSGVLSEGYHQ